MPEDANTEESNKGKNSTYLKENKKDARQNNE